MSGRMPTIANHLEEFGIEPVLGTMDSTPDWQFRRRTTVHHLNKVLSMLSLSKLEKTQR